MVNLSLLVSAIPGAKDLTQHALAAEMPLKAQATSLAQRQRRWVKDEQVQERAIYEPVIRPFIQAVSQATMLLILDTPAVGVNGHLLTVALGYQRRALPLAWQAGEGKRGHTPGQSQVELLEDVTQWLPGQAKRVVVGEGEFGNTALLTYLTQQHWPYVLRIARDTTIWYEQEWQRLDTFELQPGETIWLEQVYLAQTAPFGPVNILLVWDERHQRCVPLVTNFELGEEARYWSRKRPWIEPLFGDMKGHGFDFQTSRLPHPERLSRLMLAVALAYLWLCFLGSVALMWAQAQWVDRSDPRDRSIFTIGRQWLSHLLKLDKPIPVGFTPFPFLRLPPAGLG
jgi:DDE family transposase